MRASAKRKTTVRLVETEDPCSDGTSWCFNGVTKLATKMTDLEYQFQVIAIKSQRSNTYLTVGAVHGCRVRIRMPKRTE